MTRRNFKIGDIIGPNSRECKYGCGTMIIFNSEFKFWMEQWSNIPHPRSRCDYIKAKQKTEKNGFDPNVPRMDVVMELREVIDAIEKKKKQDIELTKQMYLLIRSLKDRKRTATIDELALALHPTLCYIDQNGNKQPTRKSVSSAVSALSRTRKGDYIGKIAGYAVLFKESGQYRYYDIKTNEEFKPVKDRVIKQANAAINSVNMMEQETINRDPIDREYEARQMDKEILNGIATEDDNNGKSNAKKRKKSGVL